MAENALQPTAPAEPAKRGRGRPSIISKEIQDLICQSILEGNFRDVAAKWAGVSQRTFHSWIARGKKEESGAYHDFLQAIQEAECSAEMKMVEQVYRAATQDPNHAKWWLERKFPERWSANRLQIKELAKQVSEIVKAHANVPAKPAIEAAKPDAIVASLHSAE